MKKIATVLIVLVSLVVIVGCKNQQDQTEETVNVPTMEQPMEGTKITEKTDEEMKEAAVPTINVAQPEEEKEASQEVNEIAVGAVVDFNQASPDKLTSTGLNTILLGLILALSLAGASVTNRKTKQI